MLGCHTANFGPLSGGDSHLPDVNHWVCQVLTCGSMGASQWCWVPKSVWVHSVVWIGYLPIPITMPYRKCLRRNFEYLQFVNSPWYMLKQATPQKRTERSKQPKATRNHPKPPKTSQKSFSKHYQSRVICETQISIKI